MDSSKNTHPKNKQQQTNNQSFKQTTTNIKQTEHQHSSNVTNLKYALYRTLRLNFKIKWLSGGGC